jgi:hypothetical protein
MNVVELLIEHRGSMVSISASNSEYISPSILGPAAFVEAFVVFLGRFWQIAGEPR